MAIAGRAKKVTTHTLQEMKRAGENITMLTSYDYSLARLVDGAGIDVTAKLEEEKRLKKEADETEAKRLAAKRKESKVKQASRKSMRLSCLATLGLLKASSGLSASSLTNGGLEGSQRSRAATGLWSEASS